MQGGRIQSVWNLLQAQAREAPRDLDHRQNEMDDRAHVQELVPGLVSNQLLVRVGRERSTEEYGNQERGSAPELANISLERIKKNKRTQKRSCS